jgi:hypothetical protein
MVSYLGEIEGIIRSLDKILSEEEGGGRFTPPESEIRGPGTAVKPCPHGTGVFADKEFRPGELISSFKQPFSTELDDPSKAWATLRVGDKWWREPEKGESDYWANFLDHADPPNAEFTNFDFDAGTGDLVALQSIQPGDEIFINYGQYAPENIEDVRDDLEQLIDSTQEVVAAPESESKEEGRWDDKPEPDDDDKIPDILDNAPEPYVSDRPIPTEADLVPTEDPTMPPEGREPDLPEPEPKATDQIAVLKWCIEEFKAMNQSEAELKARGKIWTDKAMTLSQENYTELVDAMDDIKRSNVEPSTLEKER